MTNTVRDFFTNRDLISGILAIIIGSIFAAVSLTYEIGTATNIGPGYYPLLLSMLLVVLGFILLVKWK
jgi:hypothetical protein